MKLLVARCAAALIGAVVAWGTLIAPVLARGGHAARPGSLVQSFGRGGIAALGKGTRLSAVVVQRNGRALAVGQTGGTHPRVLLARLTSAGSPDRTFGAGGFVRGPAVSGARGTGSVGRSVAIQADGKIVVVGKLTAPSGSAAVGILVERFTAAGRLDRSFGARGLAELLTGRSLGDGYGLALQPDGKILVGGSADLAGSGGFTPRAAVARLNPNGSPDRSFAGGGIEVLDFGPYSSAQALALTRSGQIVLAGSAAPGLQAPRALIARLTRSGSLDHAFAQGAGFALRQYARGASSSSFAAVALQRDGKIVAAGSATRGNANADAIVARFTAGGAVDGGFGSGGVSYATSAVHFTIVGTAVPGATGVAVTRRGEIFAAGQELNSVQSQAAAWAFTSRGSPDRSFGSGGVALASYRGAPESEASGLTLGPSGDLVTAGDFQLAYGGPYTGVLARYNTHGR